MDILYTLIPLSIALVFAIIALLCWAVFAGQFDDVEAEGDRILHDDEGNASP
jgi:cbb3-type cytochrome oxidase maturation protein